MAPFAMAITTIGIQARRYFHKDNPHFLAVIHPCISSMMMDCTMPLSK